MPTAINLWPLLGVAVIIVGFILRFNPMLVVIVTAIVTAFAAHFPVDKILATIGTGFIKTRNLPLIILLPLAVIVCSSGTGCASMRSAGSAASSRRPRAGS